MKADSPGRTDVSPGRTDVSPLGLLVILSGCCPVQRVRVQRVRVANNRSAITFLGLAIIILVF